MADGNVSKVNLTGNNRYMSGNIDKKKILKNTENLIIFVCVAGGSTNSGSGGVCLDLLPLCPKKKKTVLLSV